MQNEINFLNSEFAHKSTLNSLVRQIGDAVIIHFVADGDAVKQEYILNDDGTLRDVVVSYISEFIDSLPFVFVQFTDNVLKFCDDPFNLSKVTDLQVLIDNENVDNWHDLKTLMAISSVSNSVTKHVIGIAYGSE